MEIVVIAHNIRSTYNVGSILRTCDGFGVTHFYATGYTPYPSVPNDTRLLHEHEKVTRQIHKTALGAESSMSITHEHEVLLLLQRLRQDGFETIALEQDSRAVLLPKFIPKHKKIALLLGEEVHGTTPELLAACDTIVEIPMRGAKESFNVSVAAAIALYQFSLL